MFDLITHIDAGTVQAQVRRANRGFSRALARSMPKAELTYVHSIIELKWAVCPMEARLCTHQVRTHPEWPSSSLSSRKPRRRAQKLLLRPGISFWPRRLFLCCRLRGACGFDNEHAEHGACVWNRPQSRIVFPREYRDGLRH